MTANAAYSKTLDTINKKNERHWKSVKNNIRIAVEMGHYSVGTSFSKKEDADYISKKLEKLGYKIDCYLNNDNQQYWIVKISWDQEKL